MNKHFNHKYTLYSSPPKQLIQFYNKTSQKEKIHSFKNKKQNLS